MLSRNIDKSMQTYNIRQVPERNGKTFSLKYVIDKNYDTSNIQILDQTQNKQQNENKNSEQEFQQKIKIEDEEKEKEDKNDIIKQMEEKNLCVTQSTVEQFMSQSQVKKPQTNKPVINNSVNFIQNKTIQKNQIPQKLILKEDIFARFICLFLTGNKLLSDLIKKSLYNKDYLKILEIHQELNKINMDVGRNITQELEVQIKNIINQCLSKKEQYIQISEQIIKFVGEKIEFLDLNNPQAQNSNQSKSKRQMSRQKMNRYIYILNEIYTEKIQNSLDLKKSLIDFEQPLGIGQVDKKTVDRMVESLKKIGIIKNITKTFEINYFKGNKMNFDREVLFPPYLDENNEYVKQYVENMTHGLSIKKNQNQGVKQENNLNESEDNIYMQSDLEELSEDLAIADLKKKIKQEDNQKQIKTRSTQQKENHQEKKIDKRQLDKLMNKIFKKEKERNYRDISILDEIIQNQQQNQNDEKNDDELNSDHENSLDEYGQERDKIQPQFQLQELNQYEKRLIMRQALMRAQQINSITTKAKYFEFWFGNFQKKINKKLKKQCFQELKPDFSFIFTQQSFQKYQDKKQKPSFNQKHGWTYQQKQLKKEIENVEKSSYTSLTSLDLYGSVYQQISNEIQEQEQMNINQKKNNKNKQEKTFNGLLSDYLIEQEYQQTTLSNQDEQNCDLDILMDNIYQDFKFSSGNLI